MSRAERLDLLLRVLADRPGITAAELGRELGVSVRSVFRDLDALRERGYPIESGRGRGGGLRLHPNWGLRKLLLSAEEALGVLLSLAIAERFSLPMFAPDLGRARRKIVDAFPAPERKRLAPLRERILVGPPGSAAVRASYGQPNGVAARNLQAALVRDRLVSIEYIKENGERTARRVEPHAILLNWPAWYLLGYDHLRGQPRTFRLDRLVSVREESQGFRPRPRDMLAGMGGIEATHRARWTL